MKKSPFAAVAAQPMGHNCRHNYRYFRALFPTNMSDPINSWLAAQRESIERWLAASASGDGRTRNGMDPGHPFWQSVAQGLSPQAQELARQLAQLGPGFAAGAADTVFELFGASVAGGAQPKASPFGRWLDLAPIGYFREHHAHAQELARALAEYQRVAAQMTSAIAKIHAAALEQLAKRTEALAQAGEPIDDTRRLYNLWIECGEQAFAEHARGEIFGLLQGEFVNAATRLRVAQQTIAETYLKSLDLPTRAELNSVHKRLRDLRDRVERLEGSEIDDDSPPPRAKRKSRSKG